MIFDKTIKVGSDSISEFTGKHDCKKKLTDGVPPNNSFNYYYEPDYLKSLSTFQIVAD